MYSGFKLQNIPAHKRNVQPIPKEVGGSTQAPPSLFMHKIKPDLNSPTYRNSLSTNQQDTTALHLLYTLILNAKNENLEHHILSAPHTPPPPPLPAPGSEVTLSNQHKTPKLRKQWASPIESQSG